MIKVSVIVPVYNVEKYLHKCLDSLINQTLKEIEIICINDGSTDGSLKILKKYAQRDARIKLIDKDNEGQSIARNIGIEQAQGEYLGFVDSDDWVDLDYYEKLYDAVKKQDYDIACAGFKRCEIFVRRIKKTFNEQKVYSDINDKVKVDNLPIHNYIWNKIYKTSAWKKCGFKFESGRYYEDVAILVKILFNLGEMVTVPNTYYYYRRNRGSTVSVGSAKHVEDFLWAKKELQKFALENNIKIKVDFGCARKECIKLWNITIFKIYYFENCVKCKLFGFIPLLSKSPC